MSTALMYSFAQRQDTRVVDEPLYGHYLRVSGADHPGREEIMQAMDCDGDAVMRDLLEAERPADTPVLFLKQMAHHLYDLDRAFLASTDNILLIRNPAEMLPSLTIQLPQAGLDDTGLATQWELYRDLVAEGQQPAVVDSRELLLGPESVLRQLCSHLGITFDAAMLAWHPGARSEDGVWARFWYQSVHKSTGFAPYRPKTDFPDRLLPLLAECRPYYDQLYAHALRANRR